MVNLSAGIVPFPEAPKSYSGSERAMPPYQSLRPGMAVDRVESPAMRAWPKISSPLANLAQDIVNGRLQMPCRILDQRR